jgi:hypothetical protein
MDTAQASPTAGQISLGYSTREDRLVLWLGTGDGAKTLLVTRRLCALLINGLAGVLARSSAVAAHAPAALRDDVVLMEHQGAMAAAVVGPADAEQLPSLSSGASAAMLVETVNINVTPAAFRLVFRPSPQGDGPEITLSRSDLHMVLEMLKRQSELAQWNLPLEPGWLSASGQVTVN